MADDKKTQMGTAPGVVATSVDISNAKTSYLADVPDPLIGASIAGRYEVIRKLGEGGMGSVYLAMHTILEKQVALKVLHGEFARKPELVERFMQEAKAASRIRHENVIDVSDFGVTPDGYVFFAMELLTGHDLHEEITRARRAGDVLPWQRTKKIFLQICNALSAAHARGIVHRDLKPENVYLVPFRDDPGGRSEIRPTGDQLGPDFVKLLDFGIAKLTDVSQEEGARKLTKTGMLFGTPEYMSPEQARGERVDHRVDIYAMGCILFQLVTNRVPFEADNFMGVLSMHLTEEPPKIAPQVFDRIGAPRALAGVIDKALVKDRNRRWQTIDEMANAVRSVSGDPIPVQRHRPPTGPPPDHPLEAVRREPSNRVRTQWKGELRIPEMAYEAPRRRSKLPLAIGALVLVGAGAIAGVLAMRASDDTPATPVAVAPAQPAAQPTPPAAAPTPAPTPVPSTEAPTPVPSTEAPTPGRAPAAHTVKTPAPVPQPPMVQIVVTSQPPGATVIDLATNKKLGKTPHQITVPRAQEPLRYKLVLAGYAEETVEVVPNHPRVEITQPLERAKKPAGETAKAPVTKPEQLKPPPDEKKKESDCGDDIPCLKPMPK